MRSYPLNTMKKRQFVWIVLFVIAMGSVLLIALYSRNVQFQIGETVFVRSGDGSGLSDYEPVMCVSYETKDSNLVVFTMSIRIKVNESMQRIIRIASGTVREYVNGLMLVLIGQKTPAEAITEIERKT